MRIVLVLENGRHLKGMRHNCAYCVLFGDIASINEEAPALPHLSCEFDMFSGGLSVWSWQLEGSHYLTARHQRLPLRRAGSVQP